MNPSLRSIDSQSKHIALSIAQAALEKKGSDILVLEIGPLTSVADYFVLASGESERQVKAIAQNIQQEISSKYHTVPQIEGAGTSTWILLDYGDIVVHVFKTDVREYYGLEKMWSDASQIALPEQDRSPANLSSKTSNGSKTLLAQYGS